MKIYVFNPLKGKLYNDSGFDCHENTEFQVKNSEYYPGNKMVFLPPGQVNVGAIFKW
jgi:hypothetical protein